MLTIGVIGCGSWGKNYVRCFSSIDGARLGVLCDLSPRRLEALARRHPKTRTTTDYADVLNDDAVQAVCIATDAVNHFKIARDALKAGKDVLVEKPLATSSKECEELIQLADSGRRILMVGHIFLYNRAIDLLRNYVSRGVLGRIYYIHATRTNLGPIRSDVNAIWDLAPHDISAISYILGAQPEAVSGTGACYLSHGVEDMAFISMRYPNNVVANIHISWLYPRKTREITVIGSEKMAVFDDVSTLEKIKLYDKGVMKEPAYDSYGDFQMALRSGDITIPNVEMKEPLLVECKHFLDSVRSRTQPRSDGTEGLNVVRVVEAVARSIKQDGRLVPV